MFHRGCSMWMPFMVLGVVFLVAAGAAALWLAFEVPHLLARRRAEARRPLPEPEPEPAPPPAAAEPDPFAQTRRLAGIEARLAASLAALRDQAAHLEGRAERIQNKEGREDLRARYRADARALNRRGARLERILGLVWRTRAVALVRLHLALTVRAARAAADGLDLDGEAGPVDPASLSRRAEACEAAAASLRGALAEVAARAAEVHLAVPPAPAGAAVNAADRALVDAEVRRARVALGQLREALDRLADDVGYLADRLRTRAVVEEAVLDLGPEEEGARLSGEVDEALGALRSLAEDAERRLADSALDDLSEGLSEGLNRLEAAGLEAQARYDAAVEIERILDRYTGDPAG